MATKSLDIILGAKDKASGKIGRVEKSVDRLGARVRGVAGALAAFFSARALTSFASDSVKLFGAQ